MRQVLVGAIVICIAVPVIGSSACRAGTVGEGFKQVRIGDTEARVLALMGKPGKVVLADDKEFWSSNIKGSVREYHYTAKILPEIWVIGFDSNGIVAYRNHNIM